MTVIESFLAFASQLGEADRQSVEDALADLMQSYEPKYGFTAEELAELDRRMSDPNPVIASNDEIQRIFGHTFNRQ